MRRLALVALLASCSSPSPPPAPPEPPTPPATTPTTPAPTTPTTPTTPSVPATTGAHEPPRVDAERARAALHELRELRRMVHDGDLEAAAPRFVALARREPGNPRLHCEAGYVAQQAGDAASAETELAAGLAIYARMGSVPAALRVPYAMCLYNRGLLAEASAEGALAAYYYQRSLELRPNRTVETHLRAAEAMPVGDVPEGEELDEDELEEAFDGEGRDSREPAVMAGARSITSIRTDYPDDPESVEEGCFEASVELADPIAGVARFALVGACESTASIFRDWAFVGEPSWVDAGAPYGSVAVVTADHGGRGDDTDGHIALDDTRTLHVFAVVDGAWRHGSLVIGQSGELDCDNEACDDPETTEDDEDGNPVPYRNAFSLRWAVQAGNVVLTEESREGEVELPEVGPQPLSSILTEP